MSIDILGLWQKPCVSSLACGVRAAIVGKAKWKLPRLHPTNLAKILHFLKSETEIRVHKRTSEIWENVRDSGTCRKQLL